MNGPGETVRIKICGITNLDDAQCVAAAGADLMGFIFYPKSPRYVTPESAAAIARALRAEWGAGAPRIVGVFVDESVEAVQAVVDVAGLDLVQLHGNETPADVQQLAPRAFKAIRPRSLAEAESVLDAYGEVLPADACVPQLLVDAYDPRQYGGTGTRADWDVARRIAGHCRVLLAGGLTPDTVGEAIAAVRPWGVDVSSGVERTPGLKDHGSVQAFVSAVRVLPRSE